MKPRTTAPRFLTITAIGAVLASMALAGCDRREEDDSKAALDNVVKQAKQTGQALKAEANAGVDKAKEATRDAAQELKQAGDKASDKVADAVITTSVNAELARDAKLSAMKIDVDTDGGRVALRGTAPTKADRDHATVLASSVKGVVSVDNQLTVETGKM